MSEVLSPEAVAYFKEKAVEYAETMILRSDRSALELERDWQAALVGSTDIMEIWNKARQIGYSYGTAVRTLIRAHVFPPNSYTAIFVSINREEAQEKIRYIKELYEGLRHRKKMLTGNKMEVEFANGNRIQSYPSRPVRGTGNVDLYLDEFAHIKEARAIYSGSTASTIRQSYGICIGSTPFGRGAFYDIFTGAGRSDAYRTFVAHTVPWWYSHILCKDVTDAYIFAPGMRTKDRVYAYGTPNLIREFESQGLEIFQQEFEGMLLDFGNSVLTTTLIDSCKDPDQPCQIIDIDFEDKGGVIQPMEILRVKLQEVMAERKLHDCFIGYDVGRVVHASELILLDYDGGKLCTRLYSTLRKCPYPDQKAFISECMNNLPVRRAVIDSQGIGNQLAEELEREFPMRVLAMSFGELSKAAMVGIMLKMFEARTFNIYPTRRLDVQLMGVQKVYSTSGKILYRSMQSKDLVDSGGQQYKTHADLFWALGMAAFAAQDYLGNGIIETTSRSPILHELGTSSGWSGQQFQQSQFGTGHGHHTRRGKYR